MSLRSSWTTESDLDSKVNLKHKGTFKDLKWKTVVSYGRAKLLYIYDQQDDSVKHLSNTTQHTENRENKRKIKTHTKLSNF